MINEKELYEAIAECQGTRNPNANTCIKLASFYTILDHIKEKEEQPVRALPMPPQYSYDPPQEEHYTSRSDFGQAVSDKDPLEVLRVIDELMETLRIMQPRLYAAFIRQVAAL